MTPTVKIIPPRPLTFLRIRFAKPPLFKSFLNCSQIPQPTLRRLLKTCLNQSQCTSSTWFINSPSPPAWWGEVGGWPQSSISPSSLLLSINNEGLAPLKIFILNVLFKENALTVTRSEGGQTYLLGEYSTLGFTIWFAGQLLSLQRSNLLPWQPIDTKEYFVFYVVAPGVTRIL